MRIIVDRIHRAVITHRKQFKSIRIELVRLEYFESFMYVRLIMDELLYFNLLEEMEEAEIDIEDLHIVERHVGDPFTQLSNSMFLQIFRVSKELCQFLINSLEPYMSPAKRPTDLDISLKVRK